MASDVRDLRRLVSSVLAVGRKGDEVVLRLESPGGSVPHYGLAASELMRIRRSGMRLTVCVDRVAASGGYMMACTSDHIVAAPFAIVGSIGVVAEFPNFHRLLQKLCVDYEQETAGEYKRTLPSSATIQIRRPGRSLRSSSQTFTGTSRSSSRKTVRQSTLTRSRPASSGSARRPFSGISSMRS